MTSLHTKHTHKYTMNMNTGLNQLASLYNKDEEAKNNKQTKKQQKQTNSAHHNQKQQYNNVWKGKKECLFFSLYCWSGHI